MALLESKNIKLGNQVPDFKLDDPYGNSYDIDRLVDKKKGLIIIFTCNHCPYAKAIWPRLIDLSYKIKDLGIEVVAINPNIHDSYPDDSIHAMKEKIVEWKIPFPYLVDESQNTAKSFGAVCTPDIYLINNPKELVYHGRFDDNWKDEGSVTKHELEEASIALSRGKEIHAVQYPSIGCSIKWK